MNCFFELEGSAGSFDVLATGDSSSSCIVPGELLEGPKARSRCIGDPSLSTDRRTEGLEGPAIVSSRLCRFASGLASLLGRATLVRFAAERARVIVTSTTGVSRFVGEVEPLIERRTGVVDMVVDVNRFGQRSKQLDIATSAFAK